MQCSWKSQPEPSYWQNYSGMVGSQPEELKSNTSTVDVFHASTKLDKNQKSYSNRKW